MIEYLEKVYSKSQKDFLNLINYNIDNSNKMFIVTANPETLVFGLENRDFDQILKKEISIIVPDGIGVLKASRRIGNQVKERITGVDIAKHLMLYGNKEHKTIYLYGAKKAVLDVLIKKINIDYPNLIILGAKDGYYNKDDDVFCDIINKQPDIVLVALGIPRQELLISKYYDKFNKGIFVGVGGTFDVLSGSKKRAPNIFIKLNLEWLYRLIKEPNRIGRFYRSNIKFVNIVKNMKR